MTGLVLEAEEDIFPEKEFLACHIGYKENTEEIV